jgi:hypothetical protein
VAQLSLLFTKVPDIVRDDAGLRTRCTVRLQLLASSMHLITLALPQSV